MVGIPERRRCTPRCAKPIDARRDAKDMNGDSPLTWASWHLRPDSILRKLCYDGFSIHPERRSSYDHGVGWEVMGATKAHVYQDANLTVFGRPDGKGVST